MKTKFSLLAVLFFLSLGCGAGYRYINNQKTVAIRISQPAEMIDYDLMSSVNFMSYQLEKQGYNVLGVSYAGNLYPRSLNRAKYNIFVRAFEPFYDVRLPPDTRNIFYVERFVRQYAEEFVGYDGYITSQHRIKAEMAPLIKMHYLPSFGTPHPSLPPNDQYDVLYIYEIYDAAYIEFLERHTANAKIYGGRAFAALSEQERRNELARAKLVVYIVEDTPKDDPDFVPFAVYDIISYGRPLLTNFKPSLARDFGNNIFLLNNPNDMADDTLKALQTTKRIREQRAAKARELLHTKDRIIPDFFNEK